ncbi:MAG TPA: hypothetical protein VFU64_02540 [Gaiellaceae bacterium]|nr:hypothetical protein [Gaiellaceae bacterium]
MTELIQPLSDVAPMRQVPAQSRTSAHPPSFTELVYAHHDWWRARQAGAPDPALAAAYGEIRAAFEAHHGHIIRAYWCSHIESAVALTERKRLRGLLTPTFGFHRESDWATKNAPDVASELHRCDELAVRAKAVLTGVRQRICLELVVSAAAHLLSLVDARAGVEDEEKAAAALEHERTEIRKVKEYYCEAANGQAQLVYFAGIAAVTLLLGAIALLWLAFRSSIPLTVTALIAGAVGAVVSVIQRINTGTFELDYDVGGPYAFFLGGLRPLIGGAFGMAITFAFTGGLLHLPVSQGDKTIDQHLAYLVLAFLAGFSERWAQDTLTSVLPGSSGSRSRASAKGSPTRKGAHRDRGTSVHE